MRRIGLVFGLIVLATVPSYSEPSDWNPSGTNIDQVWDAQIKDGKWQLYNPVTGQYQELSEQSCQDVENAKLQHLNETTAKPEKYGYYRSDGKGYAWQWNDQTWWPKCIGSDLVNYLLRWIRDDIYNWAKYCRAQAKEYEAFKKDELHSRAYARPRALGAFSSLRAPNSGGAGGSAEVVSPQLPPPAVPNSGGAGGSLAETEAAQAQPPAVPSGGAGGSEAASWGSQPAYNWSAAPDSSAVPNSGGAGGSEVASLQSQPSAAPNSGGAGGSASAYPTQQTQQACDVKSFGDAQLRLLLADPKARARLTSLIAEEPAPKKAKTKQQNSRRGGRGRALTEAEITRSNSGMSPETAHAIGTIIGVGVNVGLRNLGRRGTSGTAPRGGSSGGAPRHGTYDGPPR